jgi:hypothetical protein
MELLANQHPSTDFDSLSESTAAARGSAQENININNARFRIVGVTTAGRDLELPL